nr:saxitoxin and tetrodotoxin-binding protein 1-like [Nothobranchius furzeri]
MVGSSIVVMCNVVMCNVFNSSAAPTAKECKGLTKRLPTKKPAQVVTNMTIPPHNNSEHHTLKSDFMKVEKEGIVQNYTGIGDIDYYESCSNCLLMPYKTSTHQYLISYKREGLHRDVEKHKVDHDNLKKMAECLGFRHDKQFIYNGLAGG